MKPERTPIADIDKVADIDNIYKVLLAILKREAAEIKRFRGDGGLNPSIILPPELLELDSEVEETILVMLYNRRYVMLCRRPCGMSGGMLGGTSSGIPGLCPNDILGGCLGAWRRPCVTEEGQAYFVDLALQCEERKRAHERHGWKKKELLCSVGAVIISVIALVVSFMQFSQPKPITVQFLKSQPLEQQSVASPAHICIEPTSIPPCETKPLVGGENKSTQSGKITEAPEEI